MPSLLSRHSIYPAFCAVCISVVLPTERNIALAQRPTSAFRTWQSADGKFSVVAKVVHVTDDSVVLLREDGTQITVALKQLHPDDTAYCAKLSAAPKEDRNASVYLKEAQALQLSQAELDKKINSCLTYAGDAGREFQSKMLGLAIIEAKVLPSDPAHARDLAATLRADKAMAVRKEVARLLGLTKDYDAEPILREMLTDSRPEVQSEVKRAIDLIGPIPDEVLAKRAEAKAEEERRKAKLQELAAIVEKNNADVIVELQRYVDLQDDAKLKRKFHEAVQGLQNLATCYRAEVAGRTDFPSVKSTMEEIRKRDLTTYIELLLRQGGIGNLLYIAGDKAVALERIYEDALKRE